MRPFSQYELVNFFDGRKKQIEEQINSLSDDDIMSEQDDKIINNMYETNRFILVQIEDELLENRKLDKTTVKNCNPFYDMRNKYYEYEPEYFNVDGVEITSTFPFSGDDILFQCRASRFSLSGHPEINLFKGYFTINASESLEFMNIERNKDALFNKVLRDYEHIKEYIGYCNYDCEKFNNSIKEFAKKLIDKRKEKIEKYYNVSKLLEIPINRTNPKMIEEIKIERKIEPIIKQEKNNEPQYTISDEIYHDILEMIKHQGSTFERTPQVYKVHGEEDLRDITLAFLNGHFKGKANGECFRKRGKTDISIEYENRAAFVAECKIWGGQKILLSALEQLLSYTTWRDNKLCLILFSNKNKDFFKVLEEIKDTLNNQENKISLKEIDKNEFEYKIKSSINEGQILKIRIFAFDLFI